MSVGAGGPGYRIALRKASLQDTLSMLSRQIRAGAGRTEHRMSGELNQCEIPECLISLAISLGGVAG